MVEIGIPEFHLIESLLRNVSVEYMACSQVNIPRVLINLTLFSTFVLVLSIFIFVSTNFVSMMLDIIIR